MEVIADAEKGLQEAEEDEEGPEEMGAPDAWGVSVGDDVADKVGMGGVEEKVPDVVVDGSKDIGVGAFACGLDGAYA